MAESYSFVVCTCTVILVSTVTFKQTSNKISLFLYNIVARPIKIAHHFLQSELLNLIIRSFPKHNYHYKLNTDEACIKTLLQEEGLFMF